MLPNHTLDRLYALPRVMQSLEDYRRAHHYDLSGLSDLDLDREAFGVMARLCHDREPGRVAWLVERRDAIRAERQRRIREERRSATHAEAEQRAVADTVAITWGHNRNLAPPQPRSGLTVRRGGEPVVL